MRPDGRLENEIRPVTFHIDYVVYPEGSVLISQGNTRVLCNVTVEENVPRWMSAQNISGGWITGEYSLLPRSTHIRTPRETSGLSGRTQEIRRLIGRSLRAAVDLEKLGPRSLIIDCDVLQADGGTRTAAITGGFVAMAIALKRMARSGVIPNDTLKSYVAAISAGIVEGMPVLDLCYQEDSSAQVDLNVVMNSEGEYIEVQGTAEGQPFSQQMLDALLNLARTGISGLIDKQRDILAKSDPL
ncbi:MAG: ribonuclease PH [Anaerolineales bacterium]|jgi:ribonuclease PH|nr:ribonuclease PH [Anaerolineales bacterium]